MSDILTRIMATKVKEVALARQRMPLAQLKETLSEAPPLRDFAEALRARLKTGQVGVIAEVKKASPSKGCCGIPLTQQELRFPMQNMGQPVCPYSQTGSTFRGSTLI